MWRLDCSSGSVEPDTAAAAERTGDCACGGRSQGGNK